MFIPPSPKDKAVRVAAPVIERLERDPFASRTAVGDGAGTVEKIVTGDATNDVIVKPPVAVLRLLGEHDPEADIQDVVKHLIDENTRLSKKLDDYSRSAWTLGRGLCAVVRDVLEGRATRHPATDALVVRRDDVLASHDFTVTVQETIDHDMVLRVRPVARVSEPVNER